MQPTTYHRPRDWNEGRRLRTWELKKQGWKQKDIAHAPGVSESVVSQWCSRAREHGLEALRNGKHPGPRPRRPGLTAAR